MFNWPKRRAHWIKVVRQFSNDEPPLRRAQALAIAGFKMARALASGPVPPDVWRHRMKICGRCPVRSRNDWICFQSLTNGRSIGCRCDLAMLCLTAAPGKRGCYARDIIDTEGWENFSYPTLRAKLAATWRFLKPAA